MTRHFVQTQARLQRESCQRQDTENGQITEKLLVLQSYVCCMHGYQFPVDMIYDSKIILALDSCPVSKGHIGNLELDR